MDKGPFRYSTTFHKISMVRILLKLFLEGTILKALLQDNIIEGPSSMKKLISL